MSSSKTHSFVSFKSLLKYYPSKNFTLIYLSCMVLTTTWDYRFVYSSSSLWYTSTINMQAFSWLDPQYLELYLNLIEIQ